MAGTVIWITGLPGAGKTTVAREVTRRLRQRREATVHLDGDHFRAVMGGSVGYDQAARLHNAQSLCRMCKLLSDQDVDVVCSTVSLFHECHRWNREHLVRYLEVFLQVTPETIHARDQKGLISAAARGAQDCVVGVNQTYERPLDPHLVLDNDGLESPSVLAARIVALLGP